ncbi:MAG: hypothetical protein E6J48_04215 [Chloroflexi bacterium]|nr:MAG: hypothetical protein E6J48_04215 [Chloroflexota bacterium]
MVRSFRSERRRCCHHCSACWFRSQSSLVQRLVRFSPVCCQGYLPSLLYCPGHHCFPGPVVAPVLVAVLVPVAVLALVPVAVPGPVVAPGSVIWCHPLRGRAH